MHSNYNANNSALSTTLQQTHRHATLAHHAINHDSAAHWPIYICWGAVAEETYWKARTQIEARGLFASHCTLSPFLVSSVIQLGDRGHPSVWPEA